MSRWAGRVVAITGAGSGIGRGLAEEWAARGAILALSDVRADGLAETVDLLGGADATTSIVDVADRAAMDAWAREVIARRGAVHVLVNNAGVSLTSPFDGAAPEDFDWLFGINWWGVYNGTRAFLPHLRAAAPSHLVNLSSVFGLVGIPGQSAYCAAKSAVRGFTESLQIELAGSGVSVHCVHPGAVATRIAIDARYRSGEFANPDGAKRLISRGLAPREAARRIIAAIESGRERILVGRDAALLDRLQRWFPVGYRALVRRGASRL
jgi:butyryl-CoA dehydrogenase